MILTDDLSLAEAARDRRDYDNRDDFVTRYNYKLTDLQAAIGRAQLRKLPAFIDRRREIADLYACALKSLPLTLPVGRDHVYFRYVVRTVQRNALELHLNAIGIEAKRPVYRPAHHFLSGEFPQSERAHQEVLSIPIFPAMTDQQTRRIVEGVTAFYHA